MGSVRKSRSRSRESHPQETPAELPIKLTIDSLKGEWNPMILDGEEFCDAYRAPGGKVIGDPFVTVDGRKASYLRDNQKFVNHLFEENDGVVLDDGHNRWMAKKRSSSQVEWRCPEGKSSRAHHERSRGKGGYGGYSGRGYGGYGGYSGRSDFSPTRRPTQYMVWTRF